MFLVKNSFIQILISSFLISFIQLFIPFVIICSPVALTLVKPLLLLSNVTLSALKPGFRMSGKSLTIGNFTICRPSQIFLTNENSKS